MPSSQPIMTTSHGTYKYEVTYKKNGNQTYDHIRAADKADACKKISEIYGDVTIVSVTRIGN